MLVVPINVNAYVASLNETGNVHAVKSVVDTVIRVQQICVPSLNLTQLLPLEATADVPAGP